MAEWGGADGETKPSRRARGVGPQLGRRRLDVGDGARARRWRLFLFRQPPASRVCWRWGSPVGLRSCQPSFSVRPGGRAPCGRRRGRRTRVGEAGGAARRVRPSGDVVAPAFVLFCKPPSAGFHASGSPQGPQPAGCRWTAGSSQLAARVLAGPHPLPGDRHLSAPPSCASNRVSVPAGAAVASPVGVIRAAAGLGRSVIMHPTGAVPADAYAIARPALLAKHEVSGSIARFELSGSLY